MTQVAPHGGVEGGVGGGCALGFADLTDIQE